MTAAKLVLLCVKLVAACSNSEGFPRGMSVVEDAREVCLRCELGSH